VSLVLSGLVFAGAGGVNNLAQSNWIRDKGYGRAPAGTGAFASSAGPLAWAASEQPASTNTIRVLTCCVSYRNGRSIARPTTSQASDCMKRTRTNASAMTPVEIAVTAWILPVE